MYQIDDVEAASLLYILYKRRQRRTKTKTLQPRRYWVHPLNLKRPSEGQFQLSLVQQDLTKQLTCLRVPISPEERLTVTLR
ncbi:Uncharacterized protein FWK35_00019226 [Aphis craccivora]|uniref:Uncharacterized protein n=1 Tax=Aphis craccivora TaxID=307492 RepID=A0A6G0Y4K2_APHCR|nr:Uncharacterized protein FWK35_00019226 [Aphis craccivora]